MVWNVNTCANVIFERPFHANQVYIGAYESILTIKTGRSENQVYVHYFGNLLG